jgi:hypothetical protein
VLLPHAAARSILSSNPAWAQVNFHPKKGNKKLLTAIEIMQNNNR